MMKKNDVSLTNKNGPKQLICATHRAVIRGLIYAYLLFPCDAVASADHPRGSSKSIGISRADQIFSNGIIVFLTTFFVIHGLKVGIKVGDEKERPSGKVEKDVQEFLARF